MSAWATTWAYEQGIGPSGKKAVLVALAHFADPAGFCFPSQQRLATMTAQGLSTVRAHLEALEKIDKLIVRKHRYTKTGKRTSDGFYLQAPAGRLSPPIRYSQKSAEEKHSQPPASEAATARKVNSLPPKPAHDLLRDQSTDQLDMLRSPQTESFATNLQDGKPTGQRACCRFCHKSHPSPMRHPAVVLYCEKFKLVPNEGFCHDIFMTVDNLSIWTEVLESWSYLKDGRRVERNRTDIKGMLDVYEARIRQLEDVSRSYLSS